MQLQEGTYEIAQGYRGIIVDKGTKVRIVKRKGTHPDYKRCRDCKHLMRGKYLFSPGQWWESYACSKKPKRVAGEDCFFYSTQANKKACEMFEGKEE